jgi:hypothetical protein
MTVGSDRVGDQIGRSRPLAGESVVVLTTLVDLTRQLSNLRFEVQRLVDTNSPK